jgi:signal transduction histidine kinase
MPSDPAPKPDHLKAIDLRVWRRQFHLFSQSLGLQAKLLITFMFLLLLSLGITWSVYLWQSRLRLDDLMADEARQLAFTLAQGSSSSMAARKSDPLEQVGRDLLKTRNIMFVAFFDADNNSIAFAHRDPTLNLSEVQPLKSPTASLMQARRGVSRLLGDFIEVSAPVFGSPLPGAVGVGVAAGTQDKLLGFVTVGIGQGSEELQLAKIGSMTVLVGVGIVVLCLPLAAAILHRVFTPIRQLVIATQQIAQGQLDTRVEIGRPDEIGALARSFNEMVKTVKRQRDDLALINQELEEKVIQRTGQLEAANRRLKSEIGEKEDFLRAVSHDLGAPLRNIGGMASMLMARHRDKLDADVIHRIERIQHNVEVESDLIGELLELSRIKSRRQQLAPIEIGALLNDLADTFEADLNSKAIALVIDTPMPVIVAERARLRQVFQNLIDNAIKYMGDGPQREIHIGVDVRADEAEFYVRDTGMGIEKEDLDRVFCVFRRGKNSAVRNIAGKGVGLASVKSIVETYDGSIWVESTYQQGSTFRFTINGRFVASTMPPETTVAPDDEPAEFAAISSPRNSL